MNIMLQRCLVPLAPIFAKHQREVLALRLRKTLGRRMQDPPRLFYDKLFWMSVNTDPSLWSALADKVKVKDYVGKHCGYDLPAKLYATYATSDEIDFDALPDSFAIKTNNSCGTNCLVRSKKDADLEGIRSSLQRWLNFPYGELTGQRHYMQIEPLILAEELFMQEEKPKATLVDYKFFCFEGIPRYCYVVSDRHFDQRHTHSRMIYDMQWNPLPCAFKRGAEILYADRPQTFVRMKNVATSLSTGIPFVRVDLNEVNGAVKFSEMTFLPGMHSGFTDEFQRELGDLIELPSPVGRK